MAEIIRNNKINEETALTIGFFDGVHRGHRHLIKRLCEIAKEKRLKSAVLTFDKHPREVLGGEYRPMLITTGEEKEMLMKEIAGLDYCVVEEFTKELAGQSAKEFMIRLKERYDVKVLLVGYDHRFGKDRSGSFEDYVKYGKEIGMEVIGVDAETMKGEGGKEISSTLIRKCIEEGKIEEANRYLANSYFVLGTVIEGYRFGKKIGFPTANIGVDDDKLLPADGVYAVRVKIRYEWYGGMLYIGNRPTVNTGKKSIETNVFGFEEDIYKERIVVEFVRRIREGMKFDGVDDLKQQLEKDKADAIEMLRQN